MTFQNYTVRANKIVFPKKSIVLSAAGNAGEGEWLRYKLAQLESIHDLYKLTPDEKPKLSDTFSAFVWWKGPWFINDDCFPVPIEGDYWVDGTGGDYALAFLRKGYPIHEAVLLAASIDHNSSPPIHVVDCSKSEKKILVYDNKPKTDPTEKPAAADSPDTV